MPFEVVNDGEVTALAGSMSLGKNAVLGIALGTSTAGRLRDADGNITSWLNELAFAPVDYNPAAPRDEWSGDYGVRRRSISRSRRSGGCCAPAGIELRPTLSLPEKLKQVQALMAAGDDRARAASTRRSARTSATRIAHFADFYDLPPRAGAGPRHLRRGRRRSSSTARARCCASNSPSSPARIAFHMPDEKDKRHGQAIAAASLPALGV